MLKSVILQQELISQGRQSLWALSVTLNFSQPRSVLFYTSFDGNKPCTLLNMGLKGFFSDTHTYICICIYICLKSFAHCLLCGFISWLNICSLLALSICCLLYWVLADENTKSRLAFGKAGRAFPLLPPGYCQFLVRWQFLAVSPQMLANTRSIWYQSSYSLLFREWKWVSARNRANLGANLW